MWSFFLRILMLFLFKGRVSATVEESLSLVFSMLLTVSVHKKAESYSWLQITKRNLILLFYDQEGLIITLNWTMHPSNRSLSYSWDSILVKKNWPKNLLSSSLRRNYLWPSFKDISWIIVMTLRRLSKPLKRSLRRQLQLMKCQLWNGCDVWV